MLSRRGITAAVVTAGIVNASAHADVLEFTFEGTLDSVAGTSIVPQLSGAAVGQDWSVRYTFDSETPDLAESSGLGRYRLLSYTITVDAMPFDVGTSDSDITVFATPPHRYFASAENFLDTGAGRGGILQQVHVRLDDSSSTAFDDDSLPIDLSLDDFDSFEFSYREIDEFLLGTPFEMQGTITAFSRRIVPAPGAASLLLAGIAVGIQRRRRR